MTGIAKSFANTYAVRGVDFSAAAGEVHALMGENGAGKSTLMKILAGAFHDYTGEIRLHGRAVQLHSPAHAKAAGIEMIYQELSLVPQVSIAENMLAGRLPVKRGFLLDRAAMVAETRHWLEKVGLDCDPLLRVDGLSPHEAQRVEIAKALSNRPSILVMDEPTSSLSRREVEILFRLIRELKAQGLAVIYISHHLPEVFAVSDRCTVLRDGQRIVSRPIHEFTAVSLVELMVGRSVTESAIPREHEPGEVRLRVRQLTRKGFFHRLNFEVRAGEVLGIGGLAGAGRSEFARSLCGIDPVDDGEVDLDGKAYPGGDLCDAIRAGFAYLTEDRKSEGLALFNTALQNAGDAVIAGRRTLLPAAAAREGFARLAVELELLPPEPQRQAVQFSGGNQQKVLLAKWLATNPEVCILDEPTRGVDVGAKRVIHEAIARLADRGKCVILLSSDLPELVALSDRVIIMRKGRFVGEQRRGVFTEDSILLAANAEDGVS
ncbi:MAG: sugar ABC transporter ATP-binding protein [Lacunisphaera sp.]|nr:sugar ABC transporter ATP-binding protein [Lacunisphaera sp.]